MLLVARCYLEGDFLASDGSHVYAVDVGDLFEVDEANASRLIRRMQAEPAPEPEPERELAPKGLAKGKGHDKGDPPRSTP
jgi:hypothetical protein